MVVNWGSAFSIGPGVYVIWCTIQPLDDWTEYTRSDDTESVDHQLKFQIKLSQLKKLEKCHWSWKEWSVVWIPALLLTAVWPRPSLVGLSVSYLVGLCHESEIINVTAHCKFFIRYHRLKVILRVHNILSTPEIWFLFSVPTLRSCGLKTHMPAG